ncbi:MAG: outer membrane protein assembly factor BamA [Gemmataceae bacterium]
MTGTADAIVNRRRKFARHFVLAAAAFFCILGSAQAQYQQTPIADIAVTNNRNVSSERLLNIIRTKIKPGDVYSNVTVMETVKSLIESGLVRNVRPYEQPTTDGRLVLVFDVQEHPRLIKDIVFKNVQHVSEKDLESMVPLKKGMPLDSAAARNACFEIQDYLRKKGRYFATVTLEEGDRSTDERIVFNVTEGPIVRIREIRFVGQDKLATSSRLKTQIESSRALLMSFGGIFNPMLVDNDVQKLEEYYKNNGFLKAKVSRELIFSDDYTWVTVVFHIQENERFRIEGYTLEGAKALHKEELNRIVQVKRGDYYNEGIVSGDVKNISDYYGWRGYPVMVQKDLYVSPDQPNVVQVRYEVRERPPAKVGQVFIVGNEVTQDRVIRRTLGFYPGQTLRYPELRLAENNLSRLGIFKIDRELGIKPSVSVIDPDGEGEYKDILVTVKEDHTGSLNVGAGVNSNSGLVGQVSINERNFDITRFPTSWSDIVEGRAFRGAGQEFNIRAEPGTQFQRYSVSFREPFLFDRPYSLSLNGFYFTRGYNEYIETRYGGRITLSHMLAPGWSGNIGTRLEGVNVSGVAAGAPKDFTDAVGTHFIAGPRIGLTYDQRDSFLRPTEGGIVDVSYEHVLGDYNFPMFNIDASKYFTTFQRADGSGKQVIALRSQFSWQGGDAPVFERFYAGGFGSIRGFDFRGVGPNQNGFFTGGHFMWLNSAEYQLPVKANDNLFMVAFVDSGTVETNTQILDYRVSAGVGLRIVVPALGPVPIALDFGFPIVRGEGDRDRLFSFYIGLTR